MESKRSSTLYASFDIESDGSIPCKNSMLSFGMVLFNAAGEEIRRYQRNIIPLPGHKQEQRCMDEFWSKHPDVCKFVNSDTVDASTFVRELEVILHEYKDYRINWIANPAAFDWQWLKNYYDQFRSSDKAPDIGFSAKCISTLFWAYCASNGIEGARKQALSKELSEGCQHTHNPEDDAREQGRMFFNLCKLMKIPL